MIDEAVDLKRILELYKCKLNFELFCEIENDGEVYFTAESLNYKYEITIEGKEENTINILIKSFLQEDIRNIRNSVEIEIDMKNEDMNYLTSVVDKVNEFILNNEKNIFLNGNFTTSSSFDKYKKYEDEKNKSIIVEDFTFDLKFVDKSTPRYMTLELPMSLKRKSSVNSKEFAYNVSVDFEKEFSKLVFSSKEEAITKYINWIDKISLTLKEEMKKNSFEHIKI